jgi:hypothetical protein
VLAFSRVTGTASERRLVVRAARAGGNLMSEGSGGAGAKVETELVAAAEAARRKLA